MKAGIIKRLLPLIGIVPSLPVLLIGVYTLIQSYLESGMAHDFGMIFGMFFIISCMPPAILFLVFTHGVFRRMPPVKREGCQVFGIFLHIILFIVTFFILKNSETQATIITVLNGTLLILVTIYTDKYYDTHLSL